MYNLVQTGHLSKKKISAYAREYFKKRLKRIEEILRITHEEITKDRVHELRLEIKKVKALFTLLRWANSDFPARRYYKPFKVIFQMAGDIRTIQSEQELLERYMSDSPDLYLEQLQKLMQKSSKGLKKMAKSDVIAKVKAIKRDVSPFLDKITKKGVEHFLKTNARELTESLESELFKEQDLHVIRKKLKSFYFIAKMMYPDMTIPDPWSRLLELLGKWHDEDVAIVHLRKAIYTSGFSQDEVNRLYKVKREITENRENLFDQIMATFFLIESKEGAISVPDNVVVNKIQ